MNQRKFSVSSADSAPDSAPIVLRGGIINNLKTAARLGYQGLEVHTRETASLPYDEIADVCAEHKIAFSALVTGRLNTQGMVSLIDDRPYITDAAIQGLRQYIRMAERLRTNLIIGWVRGPIPAGAAPAPYMERLAQNLRIICEEAGERGVKVFVEVINRYEINTLTTTKELIEFLDTWAIPNCYVHLDTFHMNIEESDPFGAIRLCGNKLGYFHVADNTRSYPGSGVLDFKRYLEVLEEVGYDGYISVEVLPGSNGEETARKALAHLKQW